MTNGQAVMTVGEFGGTLFLWFCAFALIAGIAIVINSLGGGR